MAGRIPSDFIDALLTRIDIVHLINSRVPLRKAGREYQACCPFHDEKTPSFTVSPQKQFYHCFGCGAHGSAIGFLMEYERQDFREAVEELAQQAGMQLPTDGEAVHTGPDPRPLYDLLDQVATLYRRQLRQHPQAPRAVDYLKERGLTGEIAAGFGLGFAPPGWDFLLGTLGADAQVRERLLRSGLLIEQDGRCYDRFRDRIMFPIRDRRGRVIGFGGRVLGEGQPKYLNSPETPVFHKGRELYGFYEARQANRTLERLLVVEGYLDVIALAQFGITYAVATLGTATSAEHLRQLLRGAPELVFCFDGDRAGRDAAWKALETALPLATGRQQIGFLFLPEGEDPDTLIRRAGRDGFEQHLRTAAPLSDALFDRLAEQVDMSSLDGRARLATLAKPLLDKVPPRRISRHAGQAPRRSGRRSAQPARYRRGRGEKRRRTTDAPQASAAGMARDRPDPARAAACHPGARAGRQMEGPRQTRHPAPLRAPRPDCRRARGHHGPARPSSGRRPGRALPRPAYRPGTARRDSRRRTRGRAPRRHRGPRQGSQGRRIRDPIQSPEPVGTRRQGKAGPAGLPNRRAPRQGVMSVTPYAGLIRSVSYRYRLPPRDRRGLVLYSRPFHDPRSELLDERTIRSL